MARIASRSLDANSPRLWSDDAKISLQSNPPSHFDGEHGTFTISGIDIGFILSDDKPLPDALPLSESFTVP